MICEWFLLCDHFASKTRPHPVLGDVPICKRCDDKMARLVAEADEAVESE